MIRSPVKKKKLRTAKKKKNNQSPPRTIGVSKANQSLVACNHRVDIGIPVILWDQGYVCPNKRGRSRCTQHDPVLNDQPTRPDSAYRILDPAIAFNELKATVHQLILHYDMCYCSFHCHEILQKHSFKGSHFYLDLDGTIYQTCDLYWKTNTAPADDHIGNERAVHVEIANLASEALKSDSEFYQVNQDQYRKKNGRWHLLLPEQYRKTIRTPNFKPIAARAFGDRGYFSGRVNGKIVRMWDFTEEQYQALIRLCIGINQLLPGIKLQVPGKSGRVPLGKISNYASFAGILGHAHVQKGTTEGIAIKYDPGPAFNWSRLRRAFLRQKMKS